MARVKMMSRTALLLVALFSTSAFAAGGGTPLMEAELEHGNIASLQRGARNFMNYCSGCHSAQYVRYKTIGKDLELSDVQLIDNLMFNAEKTFETITVSMPADGAARWFGTTPPDLSLAARAKGNDYIYSFLMGFYLSEDSPTGVDNLYLPGTSMPHVLWEVQGYQNAIFEDHENGDGSVSHEFVDFEMAIPGQLDEEAYEDFVRDTVNFLAYIAEPIRAERRKLGVWVIMFLIFFFIIASMLKKQIWKDVS